MSSYYLRKGIHLALPLGSAILLDTRSGNYMGLSRQQTVALAEHVHGWPSTSSSYEATAANDAADLIRSLVAKDILTSNQHDGARPEIIQLQGNAGMSPDELDEQSPTPAVRFHHVVTFAVAFASARLALRYRHIGDLVRSAQHTKQRHDRSDSPPELQQILHLTKVFSRIRPWFYSHRDKCLFDSLVLVKFLGYYRLHPLWVFGVKTEPFAAHSWVQADRHILNGPPAAAQDYSPILVI